MKSLPAFVPQGGASRRQATSLACPRQEKDGQREEIFILSFIKVA
jgi:hypothetical protein